MSESLNGERWREGNAGHQISTSISIRKGVYQASKKYKPAIAFKMTVTTDGVWPTGKDEPRDYKLTSKGASKEVWGANLSSQLPRIFKNASKDGLISGEAGGIISSPQEHYMTVARQEKATIYSKGYIKSQPAAGFDRLTANRTNYQLGVGTPVLEVTTPASHLHYPPPPTQPQVQQADIGGWKTKDGTYFNDVPNRTLIKRGGGGAAGILGYNFNIITGGPAPAAAAAVGSSSQHQYRSLHHGQSLRASRSVREKMDRRVDGWGDSQQKMDLISAKLRPQVHGPPPFDPRTVKRPDEPILRTRPW